MTSQSCSQELSSGLWKGRSMILISFGYAVSRLRRERCCGKTEGIVSTRKIPIPRCGFAGLRDFGGRFIAIEPTLPVSLTKISFGGGFWRFGWLLARCIQKSGCGRLVFQMDSGCVPCRSLVEPVWVLVRRIPGTVKPVEIRFVGGNPFFDRMPRRLDGFDGLDVEWWWRWARELDDAFPKAM